MSFLPPPVKTEGGNVCSEGLEGGSGLERTVLLGAVLARNAGHIENLKVCSQVCICSVLELEDSMVDRNVCSELRSEDIRITTGTGYRIGIFTHIQNLRRMGTCR